MATITTSIARGKWENRASLSYQPVNEPLNGRRYGPFGLPASFGSEQRRPYRVEESGNITYVAYDSDENADVVIYRMVEA